MANSPHKKSQESYHLLTHVERRKIDRGANEAVLFLRTHDPRLLDAKRIIMQSDMMGKEGDVRDILIETGSAVIGISAKHRHDALKHSRLSDSIDFGKEWYGHACSAQYWRQVNPVFSMLRGKTGFLWRELTDKHISVYIPILTAFIQEVLQNASPTEMMRYLLGRYDFYKVIKENGNISLQSFNLGGSLKWGKRIPLPDKIIQFSLKQNSTTTAIMNLNRGWQISFRIHSASSKIEPSLKFDVRLEGCPNKLSRHEIPFG